ncbi:hypothetical protein T265_02696 [Opisthorchis viverrini]|uniref:Uncharacterized protein n=1 Tax=Opisthorchis viverrini TaxID=6198 RepID=A0A074ZV50_OPIVI|nr:hypothetical protein T265_02696 [Opisthorchis viverrini]KER31021.1 hypothetical protein T265_02696 [Opisthorchis viverrini]
MQKTIELCSQKSFSPVSFPAPYDLNSRSRGVVSLVPGHSQTGPSMQRSTCLVFSHPPTCTPYIFRHLPVLVQLNGAGPVRTVTYSPQEH